MGESLLFLELILLTLGVLIQSVATTAKTEKLVLVCTLSEEPKTDSVPFIHVGRMVNFILDSELSPTEVVMLVKSPGGLPHVFGLVAAHIRRLIEAGIPVTACVDEVAASGGYDMTLRYNIVAIIRTKSYVVALLA